MAEPKPQISFDEFAKIDLRIARIVRAEPHPNADRLVKLQLDDGTGVPRQICAGIREFYQPENLVGRSIVIVANLAPRTIRGEESRGMLLAASNISKEEAGPPPAPGAEGAPGAVERRVVILTPASEIGPGAIVS